MAGMSVETILPGWAVVALALSVGMGVAGLGVWLAAQALEKVVRLIRRTLAAELRLRHLQLQQDRIALNGWIRDSFMYKKQAAQEKRRADQEAYDKQQIAKGADRMMRRAGTV